MTAKELHINFDIIAQETNTARYEEVTPEEKDILLNNAQIKFIQDILENETNASRKGFQDTIRRYDDLEALYESRELPLYIKDSKTLFAFLPDDYMHYDYSDSNVINNCFEDDLSETKKTLYAYKLEFIDFEDNITDDFTFSYNGQILFDASGYPNLAQNIYGNDSKFMFIKILQNEIREFFKKSNISIQMFFEKFNNKFYKNSFIFVTENSNESFIMGTTDQKIIATIIGQENSFLNNLLVVDIENGSTYSNRLIRTSAKYLLNSNFGNTKFSSPIITIENGKIFFHCNNKFKADKINLGYLRLPKYINYYTNQGSELSEPVQGKIVNKAVQFFKAISNNPEYKNLINENLTI